MPDLINLRGPRPIREGSWQHQVLAALALVGDTQMRTLYAACQGTAPDYGQFRRNVVHTLAERDLVERSRTGIVRLTWQGRQALAALCAAEPGAKPAPSAFAPRPEPAELHLEPGIERWMLTSSPARSMTEADKAPTPVRSEGMEFALHPSRRGNRLYYRDGRVTDLAGNPIEVSA